MPALVRVHRARSSRETARGAQAVRQVQYVGRRCHWLRGLAGLLGVRAALIAAAAGRARACASRPLCASRRLCVRAARRPHVTQCAAPARGRAACTAAPTAPLAPNATAMSGRRHTRRGDGGWVDGWMGGWVGQQRRAGLEIRESLFCCLFEASCCLKRTVSRPGGRARCTVRRARDARRVWCGVLTAWRPQRRSRRRLCCAQLSRTRGQHSVRATWRARPL